MSDEPRVVRKTLEVYICTEEDCASYYGSSGMPKMEDSWQGPKMEDAGSLEDKTGSRYTHNRAECPDCRKNGKRVQRQRRQVTIAVPVQHHPSPPKPTGRVRPALPAA